MSQTRSAAARHIARGNAGQAPGRGLTLVETLCCLIITGMLLAGALPSLRELRLRQTLHSAAAVLETDVQYARSLARSADRSVRLTLQTGTDGGSCYVIHTGTAGACSCDTGTGAAQCDGDATLLRVQSLPAAAAVRLSSASRSIVFDAGQGTVTPTATFVLADRDGRAVHQIVNILGRTRSCSPSGLAGYRACN